MGWTNKEEARPVRNLSCPPSRGGRAQLGGVLGLQKRTYPKDVEEVVVARLWHGGQQVTPGIRMEDVGMWAGTWWLGLSHLLDTHLSCWESSGECQAGVQLKNK